MRNRVLLTRCDLIGWDITVCASRIASSAKSPAFGSRIARYTRLIEALLARASKLEKLETSIGLDLDEKSGRENRILS